MKHISEALEKLNKSIIKIGQHKPIKINGREVGYIQLVEHSIAQIEYYLDEEHCNKGIMTRELRKYLDEVRDNFPKIIALVEKENIASQRVLEKCEFILMTTSGNYFVYVNDLQADKRMKEIMQDIVDKGFVNKIEKSLNN